MVTLSKSNFRQEVTFKMMGTQIRYSSQHSFSALVKPLRGDAAQQEIPVRKGSHFFCWHEPGQWAMTAADSSIELRQKVVFDFEAKGQTELDLGLGAITVSVQVNDFVGDSASLEINGVVVPLELDVGSYDTFRAKLTDLDFLSDANVLVIQPRALKKKNVVFSPTVIELPYAQGGAIPKLSFTSQEGMLIEGTIKQMPFDSRVKFVVMAVNAQGDKHSVEVKSDGSFVLGPISKDVWDVIPQAEDFLFELQTSSRPDLYTFVAEKVPTIFADNMLPGSALVAAFGHNENRVAEYPSTKLQHLHLNTEFSVSCEHPNFSFLPERLTVQRNEHYRIDCGKGERIGVSAFGKLNPKVTFLVFESKNGSKHAFVSQSGTYRVDGLQMHEQYFVRAIFGEITVNQAFKVETGFSDVELDLVDLSEPASTEASSKVY